MSDYITIRGDLLRAVADELAAAGDTDDLGFTEVPAGLVEGLRQYFIDGDSDDHSVGMCTCVTNDLAQELTLTLAGEMTCDKCGGDGTGWDQDKADRWIADNPGVSDCFAGYVKCDKCAGRGTLKISDFS